MVQIPQQAGDKKKRVGSPILKTQSDFGFWPTYCIHGFIGDGERKGGVIARLDRTCVEVLNWSKHSLCFRLFVFSTIESQRAEYNWMRTETWFQIVFEPLLEQKWITNWKIEDTSIWENLVIFLNKPKQCLRWRNFFVYW